MKNKKGFTLIELLATIVVLALVVGLVSYVAISAISKSKEKTYKVTIKEIESNASNYLLENNQRLFFLTSQDGTYEYQCITVENLVDYGYLKDTITESKVSNDETVKITDYVYIERNPNTKAITKTLYTSNYPEYIGICGNAVMAVGDIAIISVPKFNEWSTYKDITITYRLKNLNDQRTLDNYQFNHSYSAMNSYDSSKDTLENNVKTKHIRLQNNGKLETNIRLGNEILATNNITVDKIDITAPVVSKGNYTGSAKVRHTVTIPLIVSDVGSGFDHSTFTKDDITVNVGNSEVTDITLTKVDNTNYNLVINSDLYNGKVTLAIAKDKVFDNVKNGNEAINIDTGVTFDNKYTITYNGNGSTGGSTAATTDCQYNTDCSLRSNGFSKTGYAFDGWYTASSGGSKYGATTKLTSDITVYAHWVDAIKPTLTVSVNNGTTYSKSKTATIKISDNIQLKNGSYRIKYGFSSSQLTCDKMSNAITINVSSGKKEASANVTISSGTGAGRIYVCNDAKVYDINDNYVAEKTVVSDYMYLDNTAPTVTNVKVSLLSINSARVTFDATDSHSGLKKYVVSFAGTQVTVTSKTATFNNISTRGSFTPTVTAYDNVDNYSSANGNNICVPVKYYVDNRTYSVGEVVNYLCNNWSVIQNNSGDVLLIRNAPMNSNNLANAGILSLGSAIYSSCSASSCYMSHCAWSSSNPRSNMCWVRGDRASNTYGSSSNYSDWGYGIGPSGRWGSSNSVSYSWDRSYIRLLVNDYVAKDSWLNGAKNAGALNTVYGSDYARVVNSNEVSAGTSYLWRRNLTDPGGMKWTLTYGSDVPANEQNGWWNITGYGNSSALVYPVIKVKKR